MYKTWKWGGSTCYYSKLFRFDKKIDCKNDCKLKQDIIVTMNILMLLCKV
jgi:hypothetical protein